LSAALEQALGEHPELAARLHGRAVEFRLRDTSLRVYLVGENGRLGVKRENKGEIVVRVEGGSADYLALARARRRGQALAAGRIDIQGDLATAQDVQALLDQLEFDWEERIARVIGDVPAHQLGRLARAVAAWGGAAHTRFELDLAAYLTRELQVLATRHDIDGFARAVCTLSDDVERAAARLRRLRESRR
jgi:ubiquinone biosynthesis protein UbiJ